MSPTGYKRSRFDGRIGDTALVIEAAQGAEIAERLHLSAHTVRDYVKAVFEKVGVSSRGELVAKLFAEHYAPLHLDPAGLELVAP
jgi:Bacterial regulatory proteins, luxR family